MKQTNQQGFSLAELLIGLAVSIIIITTTAVTLGNTIKYHSNRNKQYRFITRITLGTELNV